MPKTLQLKGPLIQHFTVQDDASGAPAVIKFEGFTFALDFLGHMKCNLISKTNKVPSAVIISAVKRAYMARLEKEIDATWKYNNAIMYSNDCI